MHVGMGAAITNGPEALKITYLKDNPGIYFEEVGRVGLYSNEWQVVIYYDLEDFNFELDKLSNCTETAKNLCDTIKFYYNKLPLCDDITHQLYSITGILKQNSMLLKPETARYKRGLFNVVGTLSKTLFGTLDADDAANFDSHIEKLKDNQDYLLDLLKNQTIIVDTTVNIFNKTRMAVKEQFIHIEKKLNTLNSVVNRVRTDVLHQNVSIELETLVSLTALMMLRYQTTQNLLIDLITDVRHGKPHPSIITPTQMKQTLEIIQKQLPNSLTLPINKDSNNLLQIYQLSSVRTATIGNKIIFQVKLPLPFKDSYQLLKVYPLPSKHETQLAYIKPSLEYLLIDYSREHYYSLSKFDLQNCLTLDLVHYLCRIIHPIINISPVNNLCEIDLLKHSNSIPRHCSIQAVPKRDFWIQLSQPNKWLFSMHQPVVIDAICGNKINSYKIQNAGIIELATSCYLRTKDIIIHAHNVKESELNNHYLPSLNLTYNLPQVNPNNLEHSEAKSHVIKFHDDNNELQMLSAAISQQKQKEKELELRALSPHNIHHYTISYVLLLVIVSLIVVLLYKKLSTKKGESIKNFDVTQESVTEKPDAHYQLTMKT